MKMTAKKRIYISVVVLIPMLVFLAVFFFEFLTSQESVISDNPCRILKVGDHGEVTVYPYIQSGKIISNEFTGYVLGVGELKSEEAEVLKKIIMSEIERDYVSADVDKNGYISILAMKIENNEVVKLADIFKEKN